jgi:hypothetical protein
MSNLKHLKGDSAINKDLLHFLSRNHSANFPRSRADHPFEVGDLVQLGARRGIDFFALRAARDLPPRIVDRPDFAEIWL